MTMTNMNYDKDVFCQNCNCDAVDILARTLYGEARGEGLAGIEAVASVIINRVRYARARGGHWWGSTVKDVCLKKFQFSCWNANDTNRSVIAKVSPTDAVFALCQRVARRAVCGVLIDRTRGATHYHTMDCFPLWAQKAVPCEQVGNHVFYDKV